MIMNVSEEGLIPGNKYKILLALMGLNIGGAETHVVELAKYLKRVGHTVIVASNGGCYEAELKENGIKHYHVPLHNKVPSNVLTSYRLLKDILLEEKIDIIHAHARIPAFICGILAKKTNIPFLTTAHWVFTTGWGLKYITNWGQRTIAVSEDIKKYLIENYQIPPERIRITINGIDTDKFKPGIDYSPLLEEFGLSDDTKKIVYTGRLSHDRGEAALCLVEAVPSICKKHENIKVIIVGDGSMFEEISRKAREINRLLGKDYIIMAGGRTDINRFLAMSHIYVGVSRAALEAMSAVKPTILAGNEGYLGIFTEDKLGTAVESNFTCRSTGQVSTGAVAKDVVALLDKKPEELLALGKLGRDVVERLYSVKRMGEDCIQVYHELIKSGEESGK